MTKLVVTGWKITTCELARFVTTESSAVPELISVHCESKKTRHHILVHIFTKY